MCRHISKIYPQHLQYSLAPLFPSPRPLPSALFASPILFSFLLFIFYSNLILKVTTFHIHFQASGRQAAVYVWLMLSTGHRNNPGICSQIHSGLNFALSLNSHVALGQSFNLCELQLFLSVK